MTRTGWIVGLVVVACTVGCGGGGGGGGDGTVPPLIEGYFPTGTSLAGGAFLMVRGGAPNPSRIRKIVVADDDPATTTDGYANWHTRVPLAPGANTLSVDVLDSEGVLHEDEAVLHVENRGFFPIDVVDVTVDYAHTRVYAVDAKLMTVFRRDLTSSYRTIVSGPHRGTGPALEDPRGIAVDPANLRVWVTDGSQGLRSVIEIDLTTGNRSVLSGGGVGTGTTLSSPMGIVRDAANNRLLFVEQSGSKQAVVAVDVVTGNRTPVSDASTGAGTVFTSPVDLALDTAGGRVFVASDVNAAVYAVTLSNGNRLIVSNDGKGAGPLLDRMMGIAYHSASDTVFVWNETGTKNEVLAINPTTGNRNTMSSDTVGTGIDFGGRGGLSLSPDGTSLLASDRTHRLFRVNRTSGNRTDLLEDTLGSGVDLQSRSMRGVACGLDGRWIYTTSAGASVTVTAVDLSTAARTLVSGDGAGSGVTAEGLGRPAVHGGGSQLACKWNDEIYRVDLGTGARSILASNTVGTGPDLSNAADLKYAPGDDSLYFVDVNRDRLGRLDPATGNRVAVSDAVAGGGPPWALPELLALDETRGVAYVCDRGSPRTVLETSLSTGERTVLASNTVGSGGFLPGGEDLVFDPAGQRLFYVSDYQRQPAVGIVEIDAVTGDHDRTAEFASGEGPWPRRPIDAAYDPARHRLFVADWQLRAVILIDVPPNGGMPGDRVIVAR